MNHEPMTVKHNRRSVITPCPLMSRKPPRRLWMLLMLAWIQATLHADIIEGSVRDAISGQGLPNVIVTNGIDAVRTNAQGSYKLPRHDRTRFVSVVMPADRKARSYFRRVTAAANYDFHLTGRPRSQSFCFLQITDTETEGRDVTEPFNRIRTFAQATNAAFLVHTGDIHKPDDQRVHRDYFSPENFGRPAFFILGNHDHKAAWGHGEECFERILGAHSYAFEEGNVTFIALPMFGTYDSKPSFTEKDVVRFLRNMMAMIPPEKPVIILNHFPENLSVDGIVGKDTETPVDLRRWNVKAWIHGHTHRQRFRRLACGLPLYDGNIAIKGGLTFPSSFNYYKVAEDGTLTCHAVPTYPLCHMDLQVSPGMEQGKHTVALAATSTEGLIDHVMLTMHNGPSQKQNLPMTRRNPYLWTASCSFKPDRTYTIRATMSLNTGKTMTKERIFSTSQTRETASLRLERMTYLPGQTLRGSPAAGQQLVYYGLQDNMNGIKSGICALDATNGTLRWKISTPAGVCNSVIHQGNRVYAVDMDGTAYALQGDTGKIIWRTPIQDNSVYYAALTPPLLHNGILYCYCNGGMAWALNASDGKVIWTKRFSHTFSTNAPMYMLDGKLCLLAPDPRHALKALDPRTGDILWKHNCKTIFSQPCLAKTPSNHLLVYAAYFSAVVDPKNGIELYRPNYGDSDFESGTAALPLFLPHMGKVFVGNEFRGLEAYDATTLRTCWRSVETCGSPKQSLVANAPYRYLTPNVTANPMAIGNHVIFAAMDGSLNECDADTGLSAGKLDFGVPFISSPTQVGNRVFLADYSGRVFIFVNKKTPGLE